MTTQQLHTPLTSWKTDSNPLSNHKKTSRLSILQGALGDVPHSFCCSWHKAGFISKFISFQHCCTIQYMQGGKRKKIPISAISYAAKMNLLAMTLKSFNHSKLLQTHLCSSVTVALTKKRYKRSMVSNPHKIKSRTILSF